MRQHREAKRKAPTAAISRREAGPQWHLHWHAGGLHTTSPTGMRPRTRPITSIETVMLGATHAGVAIPPSLSPKRPQAHPRPLATTCKVAVCVARVATLHESCCDACRRMSHVAVHAACPQCARSPARDRPRDPVPGILPRADASCPLKVVVILVALIFLIRALAAAPRDIRLRFRLCEDLPHTAARVARFCRSHRGGGGAARTHGARRATAMPAPNRDKRRLPTRLA